MERRATRYREIPAEAMRAVAFRVEVARGRDTVRVCPVGDLDLASIDRVRERLGEAIEAGTGRVILDLRGVTFADSSALHLALDAHGRATRTGIAFAIVAGPPGVQRTFDVAGLSDRLPLVDVPHA